MRHGAACPAILILRRAVIEAAVNGILICGLYLPNGNPRSGPKFEYKLAWFDRLIEHAAGLLESGLPVLMAGDFNIMPTERDVYLPAISREASWHNSKTSHWMAAFLNPYKFLHPADLAIPGGSASEYHPKCHCFPVYGTAA